MQMKSSGNKSDTRRKREKKFNLPQTFDFILTFSGKCFLCNVSNGFIDLLCWPLIHSSPIISKMLITGPQRPNTLCILFCLILPYPKGFPLFISETEAQRVETTFLGPLQLVRTAMVFSPEAQ